MELAKKYDAVVSKIADCISLGRVCNMAIGRGATPAVFPHCLVYLDGVLVLLGEEIRAKKLVSIDLSKVKKVMEHDPIEYQNNFSPIEVEEFIVSSRAISGNEERLVLKIDSGYEIDLNPPFHFLGSPCVVSNLDGELIWAASVERSKALTAWLVNLGSVVEVLEPLEIQEDVRKHTLLRPK